MWAAPSLGCECSGPGEGREGPTVQKLSVSWPVAACAMCSDHYASLVSCSRPIILPTTGGSHESKPTFPRGKFFLKGVCHSNGAVWGAEEDTSLTAPPSVYAGLHFYLALGSGSCSALHVDAASTEKRSLSKITKSLFSSMVRNTKSRRIKMS